jgi:hypothetical protein
MSAEGTAGVVQPVSDLGRIEADEMSPLDEGDPPLVHETANVSGVHPQRLGELGDVEELGKRRWAA